MNSWPGRTAQAGEREERAELERTVAADHPDRHIAAPATMAAMFIRLDHTHELPIVIETAKGQMVARFRHPGDASIFVSVDRKTLPRSIMLQLQPPKA